MNPIKIDNLNWSYDEKKILNGISLNIENGKYDPARRGFDKVKLQYDTYLEVISSLTGKSAKSLSPEYNK